MARRKSNQNVKEALISVVIGASVAFLTVLFEGLIEFIRLYGEHLLAGMASTAYYLAKQYRG